MTECTHTHMTEELGVEKEFPEAGERNGKRLTDGCCITLREEEGVGM